MNIETEMILVNIYAKMMKLNLNEQTLSISSIFQINEKFNVHALITAHSHESFLSEVSILYMCLQCCFLSE